MYFRNNDFSFTSICPKCIYFPSNCILEECQNILFQCNKCGHYQYNSIHNCLNEITISKNIQLNYCSFHSKISHYYCIRCKCHLCDKCQLSIHKSHKLNDLSEIIPTNELVKTINEGYEYVTNIVMN